MGGIIAGAVLGVVSVIFGLLANIAGTITGALLGMAVIIFNWVISPGFISLSYTNAGLRAGDANFNNFVSVGWELTRSFTNIIFVIAMIIIGIGTALRMSNYQMQKTLPLLIIIALLINFTPVILGLIIDGSNIVMNFFVSGGFEGGNSFANFATRQWSSIGSLVGGLKFWDPTSSNEAIAAAVGSITLVFFNLIAAILYLVFAFLFIIRYLALWVLVILSPLAFACYVLPNTRGIWTQWWKTFTQWMLFGIIMGFFLYLGDHFIVLATSKNFLGGGTGAGESAGAPGLAGIVNSILPYMISIVLLFIGLALSLAGAPAGASAILKGGERAIKQASTIARREGWRATKGLARAPGRVISRSTERYKTARVMGRSRREAFGAAAMRPVRETARAVKGWKPPLPEAPVEKYKQARALGLPRHDALRSAFSKWNQWTPAGPKIAAAQRGLKKTVSDIWKAGFSKTGKKMKKNQPCPRCGKPIPIDGDYVLCPYGCGHQF